jgi:hypothetical protein
MHSIRSLGTILSLMAVFHATDVIAQPLDGLKVWLRSDTAVSVTPEKVVVSWKNLVDGRLFVPGTGSGPVSLNVVDGRGFISFPGNGFLEGVNVFPVARDYTLYAVVWWNGSAGANNMISGDNRAFWLNSSANPRVLHNGNFSQQSVSSVAMANKAVLRVQYTVADGIARIAVNNMEGAADVVPQNTDSTIYIGAYLRSNCFNGMIGDVMLYDRTLTLSEPREVEQRLHERFGIPRVADPTPPLVAFSIAPQVNQLIAIGEYLRLEGSVLSDSVKDLRIRVVRLPGGDVVSDSIIPTVQEGQTISYQLRLEPGLHTYRIQVTSTTPTRTHLDAHDIVCGEPIAINGQSNSIFGDPTLPAASWARTFGKNFSAAASDTLFARSVATDNGGGPNVGAWGLYLQNQIATELKLPSCVINSGVGGTAIQQHLPDPNNRLNRSTIYGSWLYRIQESGLQPYIRWLFWYQGESNSGTEDYLALFDQLYRAWKQDLISLQHIVVVQIRPGCGGEEHARLREQQRQLEARYPDVIVHAAAGLQAHDGCHYAAAGYRELGQELFTLYKTNELSMQPGLVRMSPTLVRATSINDERTTVRLEFAHAQGLRMSPDLTAGGALHTAADAFFANNDETLHPTAVTTDDTHMSSDVILTFPVPVTTVSYIPAKYYPGTNTIYEGPWLLDGDGSGVLTFHEVEVSVGTSVAESVGGSVRGSAAFVIEQDRSVEWMRSVLHITDADLVIYDARGTTVATSLHAVPRMSPGLYQLRTGSRTVRLLVAP